MIFFLFNHIILSHFYGEIEKLLHIFENDLEDIEFLNLDNFMKIGYDDLIALKLEKSDKV